MRVILDANVLVSGIFFKDPPFRIFQMWKRGHLDIVISRAILNEYRVIQRVSLQFPSIDISDLFEMITLKSYLMLSLSLKSQLCKDPNDDKFFSTAIAGKTSVMISGDRHLREKSGFSGIAVLKPKDFLDIYG